MRPDRKDYKTLSHWGFHRTVIDKSEVANGDDPTADGISILISM